MIKITMWLNEDKKAHLKYATPSDVNVNFDNEDFVGGAIIETANNFCDQLKAYKIRMEKISKGIVVDTKELKKRKNLNH